MGQREYRAIGNTLPQLGWLSEVVGYEDRLAVAWHQRVDGTKQHSRSHGSKDRSRVTAADIAKAARHPPIEPVLDRD